MPAASWLGSAQRGILARDQALAAITPMIDDLVRDMGSDKVRSALPILRELRLRLEQDS